MSTETPTEKKDVAAEFYKEARTRIDTAKSKSQALRFAIFEHYREAGRPEDEEDGTDGFRIYYDLEMNLLINAYLEKAAELRKNNS